VSKIQTPEFPVLGQIIGMECSSLTAAVTIGSKEEGTKEEMVVESSSINSMK